MEELNKENINEEDIAEADAGVIEESDITENVTETDAEPTITREKNAENDSIQEDKHVADDSTVFPRVFPP